MSTPIHTEAPVIPLIDDDGMGAPLLPADIAPHVWIAVIEQSQYIETKFVGFVQSEVTTDGFGLASFTAMGFRADVTAFTKRLYLRDIGIEPAGHARHNNNRTYLLPEGMLPSNHEGIAGVIWARWFNDFMRRAASAPVKITTGNLPVIVEPVELHVSIAS